MPDFAVNLSMLFTEVPLAERFSAAAEQGFSKVEIQFPYELPAAQILDLLQHNKQQLVLLNAPAGDWFSGDRGIACHPDRVAEFRQGVSLAIDYAKKYAGGPKIICDILMKNKQTSIWTPEKKNIH